MAYRVVSFAETVTAGTAIASPSTFSLALPPCIVRKVEVRVPPGPSGEVGFALGAAGVKVWPWGDQDWIVADDELFVIEPSNAIESGAWQLHAYNTGTYDHTLYVRFWYDPPGVTGGVSDVTLLDLVGMTG